MKYRIIFGVLLRLGYCPSGRRSSRTTATNAPRQAGAAAPNAEAEKPKKHKEADPTAKARTKTRTRNRRTSFPRRPTPSPSTAWTSNIRPRRARWSSRTRKASRRSPSSSSLTRSLDTHERWRTPGHFFVQRRPRFVLRLAAHGLAGPAPGLSQGGRRAAAAAVPTWSITTNRCSTNPTWFSSIPSAPDSAARYRARTRANTTASIKTCDRWAISSASTPRATIAGFRPNF